MKSQLLTTLSIVGVLGTATTAMAVNTDVLASLDPSAIGTATDTLLPAPASTELPAPTATPAPADPSAAPVDPSAPAQPGTSNPGGSSGSVPVVQNPQTAIVNGTSGGSGSRVDPATGATVNYEDDDHDEDEDHDEDHEEEDDD